MITFTTHPITAESIKDIPRDRPISVFQPGRKWWRDLQWDDELEGWQIDKASLPMWDKHILAAFSHWAEIPGPESEVAE